MILGYTQNFTMPPLPYGMLEGLGSKIEFYSIEQLAREVRYPFRAILQTAMKSNKQKAIIDGAKLTPVLRENDDSHLLTTPFFKDSLTSQNAC